MVKRQLEVDMSVEIVDYEMEPGSEIEPAEPEDQTFYLPTPVAQQVFSLVPAAAGVACGLIFAAKLTQAKATHVKASEVIGASVVSFLASLAVVFMIRTFKSYE